ncbi:hypothetical protein K440DRAFT_661237 [Wilcoxina mikolae CBS 423.85]|nr:hypothetical protein K440DRAFT_661237 [Wilcoxina mikolae CBS 423.85]
MSPPAQSFPRYDVSVKHNPEPTHRHSSNSKKMPVRNDTRHRHKEDDYYAQDHVPTKDELDREIRYQRLHKAGLTPGQLRKKGAPEDEVTASFLYLRGIKPHRDGITDEPINPAREGKNSDEVEEEYFNYYVEEGVSNAPKPKPRKPKERYRSTYHPPGAVYNTAPPGGSPPTSYNSRLSDNEARHAAMATSFCRRDYCRWHNPYGASYSNAKRTDDRNPFFSGEGGEKAIEAEQSPLRSLDSVPPGPGAQEAYPQAVEVSNTSQDRPEVQILSKPQPKDAVTGSLESENSLAAAKVNPKPAGNDTTTLKPTIPSPPTIETKVVAVDSKTKVDTALTETKVDRAMTKTKVDKVHKPQSKDVITGSLESKNSHAAAKANPKPAGSDTATLKPAIPSPPTTKITVETKAKADTPVARTKVDTVEPKTKVETAGDAPHPKSKSKPEDTGNVTPSPAPKKPRTSRRTKNYGIVPAVPIVKATTAPTGITLVKDKTQHEKPKAESKSVAQRAEKSAIVPAVAPTSITVVKDKTNREEPKAESKSAAQCAKKSGIVTAVAPTSITVVKDKTDREEPKAESKPATQCVKKSDIIPTVPTIAPVAPTTKATIAPTSITVVKEKTEHKELKAEIKSVTHRTKKPTIVPAVPIIKAAIAPTSITFVMNKTEHEAPKARGKNAIHRAKKAAKKQQAELEAKKQQQRYGGVKGGISLAAVDPSA